MDATFPRDLRDEMSWRGALARFGHALWDIVSRLSESRMALVGALIFVCMLVMGLAAPLLATHDPIEGDFLHRLAPPSSEHWLGTDQLGRDIWSRIVYGAGNAMLVGFTVVPGSLILGIVFGGLPGYFGGRVDNLCMRLNDAFLAFPGLILFLAIIAVLGRGLWTAVIALIIGGAPSLIRLTRGLVLAERERDYVKAAKLIGEPHWRILFAQIIPNVSSPMIVMATVRLGGTLLMFAALSFLGLGPPPPEPSWGLMLNEAKDLLETAPMTAVYPGLAISIAVLGINLLGDGLRDVLDPRLAEK